MKILTAEQIKQLDAYTIEHEPIASIDLMERASRAFANRIMAEWAPDTVVKVFAGPGNNGGDALAVSRMLAEAGYAVSVYLFNTKGHLSPDCEENKQRLLTCGNVDFVEVTTTFDPPVLEASDLVIDGLFGTGVTRPLNGGFASVVKYINASCATVVAIDVPSGLMCLTISSRQDIHLRFRILNLRSSFLRTKPMWDIGRCSTSESRTRCSISLPLLIGSRKRGMCVLC